MKQKYCPHCSEPCSVYEFTCVHCGEELAENGYFIDSLTYWDVQKPAHPARILLSLTLVSASAIAASLLHLPVVFYAGLAAAALYYTTAKSASAESR
ncbi:hypothetical protein GCM10023310_52270 [Paenibacillus vulneris]|uniref:Zinc ribbon domain-containing protein n=1 Tax=Paenibacillus vulneris TaxID=1133364 RepID=A0ABW3ULA8_9BACL|nr:hypothetical protein [Paenibacillus sp. 32352]